MLLILCYLKKLLTIHPLEFWGAYVMLPQYLLTGLNSIFVLFHLFFLVICSTRHKRLQTIWYHSQMDFCFQKCAFFMKTYSLFTTLRGMMMLIQMIFLLILYCLTLFLILVLICLIYIILSQTIDALHSDLHVPYPEHGVNPHNSLEREIDEHKIDDNMENVENMAAYSSDIHTTVAHENPRQEAADDDNSTSGTQM